MRRPRPAAVAASLALVALVTAPRNTEAQAGVRPLAGFDLRVVDYAREGAIRRLQSPECRQVLTDFRDPEGRTPLENLAPFGVEPDQYLAQIPFLDGTSRPLCQGQSQLLTTRGIARIFVCKSFYQTVQQQRDMAEIYVIHEMLHTLGLGENPPTSLEITQQVKRRCGR
jgi:hypothetical protein